MAGLAQTSYYAILENPSGHRLIQLVGRAGFTAKGKKKTLTVRMGRVVHGHATPGQAVAAVSSSIPYISASQYTTTPTRKIIVSRATGVVSALVFSYSLVGY